MPKVFYVRKKTPVMPYRTWMELTKGKISKPRSRELKKLDKALKTYHEAKGSERALKSLDAAFNAWCKKAGENRFKQTVRNRFGAVSQLGRQITETLSHAPFVFIDKEIQEAIDFMESEQVKLNRMVFLGAQVVLKSDTYKKSADEIKENLEELKDNMEELTGSDLSLPTDKALETLTDTVHDRLGEVFGGELATVAHYLGPELGVEVAEEIISNMVPIYAQLKAGAEMLKAWVDVARKQYKIVDVDRKGDIVNAKDPAAALSAVVRLLKRERTVLVQDASAASANFASSVSTALVDGGISSGAIVGAATAMANLVRSVVLLIRDIKEMKYANTLLAKGVTNLSIFEACPLLGCYLFCPEKAGFQYSAFSGLVRQSFSSWGTEGYVQQLEYEITKKLGTIKEEASRLMDESRLAVVGIGKGTVIKEGTSKRDSAVQRLCLRPVERIRETDPLARIRMLHQIKRKVYLKSISSFDKSGLKHVGTRDRSALRSDIRGFDRSRLKSVKTRVHDPITDITRLNLEIKQFRGLDHLPMTHTYFNREMFARKAFIKGVLPCTYSRHMMTLDEWKSASSIRGMRTKLTRTIDDALKAYEKAAASAQKAYVAQNRQTREKDHNLVFLEKGRTCIQDRLDGLGGLKATIEHWLDVKKDQVNSKRRPAVYQIYQCTLQEEESLSGLMDVFGFYLDKARELGLKG